MKTKTIKRLMIIFFVLAAGAGVSAFMFAAKKQQPETLEFMTAMIFCAFVGLFFKIRYDGKIDYKN